MQVLTHEKDVTTEYKKQEEKSKERQQKTRVFESPSTLMRQRQLQKRDQPNTPSSSSLLVLEKSGGNDAGNGNKVPYDKLLEGVVAYLEIFCNESDRSAGAKALMISMGAVVRDMFIKDVTHVVFKDGSYTTYLRAKLLKTHLVSVLWLEAVRRNGQRVPEENYPALGVENYDINLSTICSQLQCEEIVRKDLRRSIALEKSSISNNHQTFDIPLSNQCHLEASSSDRRVNDILFGSAFNEGMPLLSPSPDIISDSSDCGVIDGEPIPKINRKPIVNGDHLCHPVILDETQPEPSDLAETPIADDSLSSSAEAPVTGDSLAGCSKSFKSPLKSIKKPHNISCADQESGNSSFGKGASALLESNKRISSDKSTDCSNDSSLHPIQGKIKTSCSSTMSSLRLSSNVNDDSQENRENININISKSNGTLNQKIEKKISVNRNKSACVKKTSFTSKNTDDFESKTSSINSTEDNSKTSIATSMSSLRISSDNSISGLKTFDPSKGKIENQKYKVEPSDRKSSNDFKSSSFSDVEVLAVIKVLESTVSDTDNSSRNSRSSYSSRQGNKSTSLLQNEGKRAAERELFVTKRSKPRKSLMKETSDIGTGCKILQQTEITKNNESLSFTDKQKHSVEKPLPPDQNNEKRRSKRIEKVEELKGKKVETVDTKGLLPSSTVRATKKRKLYNPDGPICMDVVPSDVEERLERRNQAMKKLQDEFLNPNLVPIVMLVRHLEATAHSKVSSDENNTSNDRSLSPICGAKRKPKTRNKRRVRRDLTPAKRDSSTDEQKSLLEEILGKSNKNMTSQQSSQDRIENKSKVRKGLRKDLPETPITKRRSTLDFESLSVPLTPLLPKGLKVTPSATSIKNKKKNVPVVPTIVCTKLHRDECQMFVQIVKKLGGFAVEEEVSDRTTHLVVGEAKRTVNMLRAMARGCWILRHEWLLKSLEYRKWLPEEDYEVTEFSPVIQHNRIQRQAFGPSYRMDLFKDCGKVHVTRGTSPRCSDLQELLELCGGCLARKIEDADLIVGNFVQIGSKQAPCVTELWLLDSISHGCRKPYRKYKISSVVPCSYKD